MLDFGRYVKPGHSDGGAGRDLTRVLFTPGFDADFVQVKLRYGMTIKVWDQAGVVECSSRVEASDSHSVVSALRCSRSSASEAAVRCDSSAEM